MYLQNAVITSIMLFQCFLTIYFKMEKIWLTFRKLKQNKSLTNTGKAAITDMCLWPVKEFKNTIAHLELDINRNMIHNFHSIDSLWVIATSLIGYCVLKKNKTGLPLNTDK